MFDRLAEVLAIAEPANSYLPRLKDEGFHLVETPAFEDADHVKMLAGHGLLVGAAVTGLPSESKIAAKWDAAKAAGVQYIRFKFSSAYAHAADASTFLGAIQAKTEELEIPALLETHRNTATQDLFRTASLLRDHPRTLASRAAEA